MQQMRSPVARAAGLGSARAGVGHWWLERVTAIALVPLTLWFAASLIMLSGKDYASVVSWMRSPAVALLMISMLISLFLHLALGLRVVIEDYIHTGAKFAALITVRFVCFVLCVAGILATLRLFST